MKLAVCHISTFSPTQCGVAAYTEDLIQSLSGVTSTKIRLSYDDGIDPAFQKTIGIRRDSSYDEAVAYINESVGIDLVSIQHEFGIFGGPEGAFVLKLANGIRKPIVTTLHTVRRGMHPREKLIIEELASRSSRVVVLTEESATTLIRGASVPASKVKIIRQGIPEVDFRSPELCAARRALHASVVFISAGHLRPTKGYHIALQALAQYKEIDPHFKYVILGTHQAQFPVEAAYQIEIGRAIARLGLEANVMRVDSYLSRHEMLERIMGADIGLVTYTEEEQNASAILPLFLGCGRVVISTAFECARSIHKDIVGLFLAEMDDPVAVFRIIAKIAPDKELLSDLMAANYRDTRGWVWPRSAEQYKRVFEESVKHSNGEGRSAGIR
jgi:glycosyltransferase involved in cell wall biosynthesis